MLVSPRSSFIFIAFLFIVRNCYCDGSSTTLFDMAAVAAAAATDNSTENGNAGGRNGDDTTEIHRATCKIKTKEFVAEAQATFTRILSRACDAQTMNERFEKLERSLNGRLDEIERLIVGIDLRKSSSGCGGGGGGGDVHSNTTNGQEIMTIRRAEIERFNDSVREIRTNPDHTAGEYGGSSKNSKVYSYYWRVSNVREKLFEWDIGRSERSRTFRIKGSGPTNASGYAMYLRFTPKYFPDGTIFVSVGLTRGQYDSNMIWPFPLKIRLEILDLDDTPENNNGSPRDDRSSRLWDPATLCPPFFWARPPIASNTLSFAKGSSYDNPECVGLSLPRRLFVKSSSSSSSSSSSTGKYISNDCLLVKLSVYL